MEDKTLTPTAPPPASEVKIRTMRSDINSMMQNGGGAPSFQNVSISGLTMDKKFKAPTKFVSTPMPVAGIIQRPATENTFPATPMNAPRQPIGEEVANAGPGSDLVPKLLIGLVGLIALGVVAYFAYTLFF